MMWGRGVLGRFRHPTQVVATGFGAAVLLGTVLLSTPLATASGKPAGWITALFTATSAVCVTGLTVVDTAAHWSAFGEVVIAVLIQVGGLGIMTLATVFTLLISRRLSLRTRLSAQAETKVLSASDLRRVVAKVVLFSLACEAVAAAVLTLRFVTGYAEPVGHAVYLGVFHAVSAFNNAGFALWPDNLVRFVGDPWICLTVAAAVIVGGLGFPVLFELRRSWRRPSRWSLLTRVTLAVTVVLLAGGTLVFLATEWSNSRTLGQLDGPGKMLAAFFTAVMPRTAGFNSLDLGHMYPSSWLVTDLLMFVGGGSAGTAGGIKVTTIGLLAFIVWTEMRGESRVNIGHRRLPEAAQRQAVSLTVLSGGLVACSTYILLVVTPHGLDRVLFEVVSAFGTTGLSTGITASIPPAGHLLLIVLMFVGRIGPLTLGSALALKERTRRYELPEEGMIVG
ncbi:TrkH family potassium uptake protein [Microbispora triticiradicis]|uniref:TrkH family potassium uptake protein n=1 Tax=Microbispora triticiradicis TaxID=2200763 RepID=UPI001AD6DA5D|nr:potassium transporter TrkG [Microbispora triticiradicis]MBO4269440.1 TrkH family potassium uptake protein [Microbispora triticiradicis]